MDWKIRRKDVEMECQLRLMRNRFARNAKRCLVTIKFLPILLLWTCLGLSAHASPETIWSIGVKDNSGREFALFGNYGEYASHFPSNYTYYIGKSIASDWPYIQPGPVDSWAGNVAHSLSIAFPLESVPAGECTLVLDIVSAQGQAPPTLKISINGAPMLLKLPPGPGDIVLSDEKAAHPQSFRLQFNPKFLKAGSNRITITTISGSWVLYDALHLETDPDVKPLFLSNASLLSDFFFLRRQGKLMQVVTLNVYNDDTPGTGEAVISYNGTTERQSVALGVGDNSLALAINPVKAPTPVTVHLLFRDHDVTVKGEAKPQRKWTVCIVPSVHIDVGYTELQSVVRQRHDENLDNVIKICEADPNFRWNIEGSWVVQNYLADRPASQRKKLIKLLQEGRIELTAGYFNMLTGLMSNEEMNRYAYVSAYYHRKYGFPLVSADLTDVPSANMGLEMALAGSGIRFFAEGVNQTRALTLANSNIHTPFYWEGADGSRLLCWLSNGYGQSIWMDQNTNASQSETEDWIRSIVNGYNNENYPYNLIYVYGAMYENSIIDLNYGKLAEKWDAHWAYPKLELVTESQFFRQAEKEYGNHFPVVRGSFGSFWEDGAGSTALETTMNRNSQRRITQAQTLWSLANLLGNRTAYPVSKFDSDWQQIFLYDEHTWGAAGSISDPDSSMTKTQWAVKKQYAFTAMKETNTLLAEGLSAYIKSVPARPGDIVVCNTHSWEQSGLTPVPEGLPNTIHIVDSNGKTVPTQKIQGVEYFYAENVPGLGYRTYRLQNGRTKTSVTEVQSQVMENRFYRIRLSPKRGIDSVIDRETGKNLVDSTAPYFLGQVIYASGADGTRLINSDLTQPVPPVRINNDGNPLEAPAQTILVTPEKILSISPVHKGALFSYVTITSEIQGVAQITTDVRLYNRIKRIEFDINMMKTPIRLKEAMYVAFPFQVRKPHVIMDTTEAIIDPVRDMIKGSCNDWYSIRDWVSEGSARGEDIVWSSPDAPLITLSDINRGEWYARPHITNGYVFSYVMNNYWFTNYKADQGGAFRFRYAITSSAHKISALRCEQFANAFPGELPDGISQGVSKEDRIPVRLQGGNVSMVTMKKAQDGYGYILRIRNLADKATQAHLFISQTRMRHAELDNLIEEKIKPLTVKSGGITIDLKPMATATVRIYP